MGVLSFPMEDLMPRKSPHLRKRRDKTSFAKMPSWSGDRVAMPIWPDACEYLGKISRSMFYKTVLPHVECIYIGTRRCPTRASLDKFAAERTKVAGGQ